jgi:colanic acid biosynthesis glycosyl transferase WcaI
MRILLLEQFFDPEPTFKGLAFARKLVERGHQVEVLTGFPNYPGGQVYPGYRVRFKQIEWMEGIRVNRVPLFPSHDRSSVRRIANYTSFTLAAASIGAGLIQKPDVIYCYHPPATIGGAAVVLSRLNQCPFVYDIQDLWPDTVAASGMLQNKIAWALIDRWCRWVYRHAAQITVLSPGFKARLVERGVPASKITVIYNWADETKMKQVERDEALARSLGMAGKFNITFAGTMGLGQALDTVLEAAALLRERAPDIQFVFVGGGVEKERLEAIARRQSLSNVLFLPRRAPEEMPPVFALSDVLLVHLKDDPLFRITIPSKTQTYMAVGKPILMAVPGDAADLVTRAGCGVVCPPEDAPALAEAAWHLFQLSEAERAAMGQRGREFYQRELSMDVGVRRFEDIFSDVVAVKSGCVDT